MKSPHRSVAGAYLLLIRVEKSLSPAVGRLGTIRFQKGWYAYCGSAKGGVQARVARHCRRENKSLHWHIDYLLDSPWARVVEARAFPGHRPTECDLVRALMESPGAAALHKGFGASDCKQGCPAHLLLLDKKPDLKSLFPDAMKLKTS